MVYTTHLWWNWDGLRFTVILTALWFISNLFAERLPSPECQVVCLASPCTPVFMAHECSWICNPGSRCSALLLLRLSDMAFITYSIYWYRWVWILYMSVLLPHFFQYTCDNIIIKSIFSKMIDHSKPPCKTLTRSKKERFFREKKRHMSFHKHHHFMDTTIASQKLETRKRQVRARAVDALGAVAKPSKQEVVEALMACAQVGLQVAAGARCKGT